MLYLIAKILLTPFVWLIYRPQIHGRKNWKVKGKAIFICNHSSMWDPVMLALFSKRWIHFMAKAELFEIKWLKPILYALFAFPINRKQADRNSIRNAMRVLDKGKVFGIFPEGKRSVTGNMDAFEKGAAFLALRAKAPVVPIYISPDSYQKRRMRVFVGEVIDIEQIAAQTPKSMLMDTVANTMEQAVHKLARECQSKSKGLST